MVELVLYMKPGCHLCENAEAMLDDLKQQLEFTYREVDIRQDPALFERFCEDIPVIELEGKVLLSAPIHEATARRVLAERLPARRPA